MAKNHNCSLAFFKVSDVASQSVAVTSEKHDRLGRDTPSWPRPVDRSKWRTSFPNPWDLLEVSLNLRPWTTQFVMALLAFGLHPRCRTCAVHRLHGAAEHVLRVVFGWKAGKVPVTFHLQLL